MALLESTIEIARPPGEAFSWFGAGAPRPSVTWSGWAKAGR